MYRSGLIRVEGHDDLQRDPNTNAILHTNQTEYEKYINARNAKRNLDNKVEQNSKELSEIKTELQTIKELLLKLTNQ
jgi:hypothetical protein